jgi:hypothetical protein
MPLIKTALKREPVELFLSAADGIVVIVGFRKRLWRLVHE